MRDEQENSETQKVIAYSNLKHRIEMKLQPASG